MKRKLKVALLGYGGMGHFHASCYADQPDCELIAVCDVDPKQFEKKSAEINLGSSGKSSLDKIAKYLSYDELVRHEKPDFIDICIPGHLHEEYAIRAMKDGFHVLCEKPMARTVRLADEMIRTSDRTGRFLMVAQCLRFDPIYCELKKMIESGKYGKLLRFDMHRLSTPAGTRKSWYRNAELSGGALFDLHLHNTDFIQYMLGIPDAVQTFGVSRVSGGIDDLITHYYYSDGPMVFAESSWCRPEWSCSTVAVLEKATLQIAGDHLLVFQPDKPVRKVKPEGRNGYWNEIRYFSDCILRKRKPETASPESTRESIRIALMEEKSALSGRKIKV